MTYKRKYIAIILGVLTSFFWSLFLQAPQLAAAKTEEDFINQALVNALGTCYGDTYTNRTFTMTEGARLYSKMLTDSGKRANIYLPFKTSPISCETVIVDTKTEVFGNHSTPSDPLNFGYKLLSSDSMSSDKSPDKCVSIKYQYYDGAWLNGETNRYCFSVNENGSINEGTSYSTRSTGPYSMGAIISDDIIYLSFDDDKESFIDLALFDVRQKKAEANAWQSFIDKVNAKLKEYGDKHSNIFSNYTVYGGDDPDYKPEIENSTYEKKPINDAINTFLQFASGNQSIKLSDYSFSNQDKVDILQSYINQALQSSNGDGLSLSMTDGSCWEDRNSVTAQYAYPVSGHGWCELRNVNSVPGSDYIVFSGNLISGGKTFSAMMTQFMSLSKNSDVTVSEANDPTIDDGTGTTAGEAGTIAPCYEGTGVLGWIVCPVLEAVGAATGWMYNSVIEPALEIKTSILFSDRSDSGVYGAWSAFRTFANILFAIAFVIIILSQVTGIGITNYGIKKMLPRLIIVVVLVNISYILCQLAVDVSNILGSSLKSLFEGIEIPGVEGDSFVTSIGMILNGLGLAGAVGSGVGAVLSLTVVQAGLSYLAIPLVLTVIGCLIAIIFFFILLSVRQAGVVVLVVLAPLAVVCYALPNTKSLFDRWRKLFTAMLFVYPICGIVMGGGNFVSALLLSMLGKDGGLGFFYTVSAMLVSVVPFFMIPSILKSSMAMAGNLGAKISNFGAGLSNGLNRGIRNSELYKDHQLEEARRLGIRRNQVKRDRLSATGEGGGLVGKFRRAYGLNNNLSNRQRAIVGRSQSSLDRATDERALALRSAMEQSGMADDQDALLSEFNTATDALLANENDFEALERQKAAAGLLLRNGKGRSVLLDSLQKRATSIAGMSDEKKAVNAMRTMQRSLSSLDRTYGADIAKSPILKEQVKNMRNLKDYGTRANYANVNKTSLKDSSESLNSRVMSEASKHDLNAYLKAIEDGDIKYGDREFNAITSAAAGALSDKNFKGNIDEEALAPMRKLAGMKFNPPAAARASFEDISASIADASDDEMSHLQSYLQDNATPAAEKADIIANLSRTLGRSLSTNPADASFKLNSSRTQQLGDILSKNGQKIGDVGVPYGINRQTAEDRFDLDTGVRIDHSNHKTLNDYHPDWQHANHDNISGAYKKGDWVEAIRDSSGAIVDYRKLDPREVKEADKLEDKDIEVKHSEIDQENAAKRRWNRP